jgi:hypothetical protein
LNDPKDKKKIEVKIVLEGHNVISLYFQLTQQKGDRNEVGGNQDKKNELSFILLSVECV